MGFVSPVSIRPSVQLSSCAPLRATTRPLARSSCCITRCSLDQGQRISGRDCSIELNGRTIAFDYFPGTSPAILFLPGFFFSRWRQAKVSALEIFAKRKGQAILVEEYLGIGGSGGDFVKDGTLTHWIDDTVRLIDEVVQDKVVLVGAGVGGWIMLHVAQKRPEKVVGCVGINPSLDFTEDLIKPALTEEQKKLLEKEGIVEMQWGYSNYKISEALLEDAEKWLVLRGEPGSVNVSCPIRLLQGLSDEELPPTRTLDLAEKVTSEDCVVSFIKWGDHSLESERDFQRMWEAVCELTDSYFEYDLTSPSSG